MMIEVEYKKRAYPLNPGPAMYRTMTMSYENQDGWRVVVEDPLEWVMIDICPTWAGMLRGVIRRYGHGFWFTRREMLDLAIELFDKVKEDRKMRAPRDDELDEAWKRLKAEIRKAFRWWHLPLMLAFIIGLCLLLGLELW